MDAASVESIKFAAQITSTLVAVLALIIGLRNEARNQKRFNEQLSQSRKIAQAAARPLLFVDREGYEDEKAITLANHGPGTAIVKTVTFARGGRRATEIAELLDLDEEAEIIWNESTSYATPYYMAAKSSEDAFRITADRLTECGVPIKRVQPLLDEIEEQLDEIEITLGYEDVFGERFQETG
jgi:hypothetical protein